MNIDIFINMVSQKNADQKYCIKCQILLQKENWPEYLQNKSNYLCFTCFKQYNKIQHQQDGYYNQKQRNRHRMRKSAIIFQYGNECINCKEDDYSKLSIDFSNNTKEKKHSNYLINYLYNNTINSDYQILCWNCKYSKNKYDKYYLSYKKQCIQAYGFYCTECQEDKIEKLKLVIEDKLTPLTGGRLYRYLIINKFPNLKIKISCYNCYYSMIYNQKVSLESFKL